MFARCRSRIATAASDTNTTTGHGSPIASATKGSAAAVAIDATEAYRVATKSTSQSTRPISPTTGASPTSAPPRGRDRLAALLEAEEERPPVAEHRRPAGERSDELVRHERPDERRHEALRHVEHDDRHAVGLAVRAPDVRRADVAAAHLTDVLVLEEEHEPVPERHRTEEVRAQDDQGRSHA